MSDDMPDDPPSNDPLVGIEQALSNIFGFTAKDKTAQDAAFFRAVRANRLDVVEKALQGGMDPNMFHGNERAMHIAARGNLTAMIRLLNNYRADPSLGKKDDPGHTPLTEAINFGKEQAAETLALIGGYTGSGGKPGWTPLHNACEKGKTHMVMALLRAGADGNERTEKGSTPLIIAVVRSKSDLAEKLLDFPTVIAGLNGCHADSDARRRNAFLCAAENGLEGVLKKMIARGADVNATDSEGLSALHYAIERPDLGILRLLLEAGIDVNKAKEGAPAPLLFACQADLTAAEKGEIVRLLLKFGADPDALDPATGKSALMLAIDNDEGAAAAEALLRYPLHADAADHSGRTPLMAAIEKNDPRLLQRLLARGANPDMRHGGTAATPLIVAVQQGSEDAVAALLKADANPALYDARGLSPLGYARQGGDARVIKLLEDALLRKFTSSKPGKLAP